MITPATCLTVDFDDEESHLDLDDLDFDDER